MTVETVRRVLGGIPPIAVRDRYAALAQGRTKVIFLAWDEIKDIDALAELTFWDGEHGVSIRIE